VEGVRKIGIAKALIKPNTYVQIKC